MSNSSSSSCCPEPPHSTFDILILVAMVSVFLGLIISTVGYVYPRDNTPDPSLTAREQEAVDIYYNNLSNNLDICIVVGMGCIGLGGLVTSAVFCKTMICRECDVGDRDEENYTLADHPSQDVGLSYGTVEGGQGQPRTGDR